MIKQFPVHKVFNMSIHILTSITMSIHILTSITTITSVICFRTVNASGNLCNQLNYK